MIEKCIEFRRFLVGEPSYKEEIQICNATGQVVSCGGFSDACEFPSLFKSVRGISNEEVTFPYNLADIPQLEERIRERWERHEREANK